jgi:hypothetical protein
MSVHIRCALSALVLTACNVGSPIVDKFGSGDFMISCNVPPPCEPLAPIVVPRHQAVPFDMDACQARCGADEEQNPCGPASTDSLPLSAACQRIAPPALLSDEDDTSELTLSEVEWRDLNIVLKADKPVAVTVSGGALQRVSFTLTGPIALRIEHASSVQELRIAGTGSEQGAPSFELVAGSCETLSVGTALKAFPGEVILRGLNLQDVDVRADAVTLESSLLSNAVVRAGSFTLNDASINHTRVEADRSVISAFDAGDSELSFCGDARMFEGTAVRSAITVCEGTTLRMYGSNLFSGSLDGPTELVAAALENTRVAVSQATSIISYESRISAANMCSNTELIALGRRSGIRCSACSDELLERDSVCALDESKDMLMQNYCRPWNDADPLPECGEDLPRRPDRFRE